MLGIGTMTCGRRFDGLQVAAWPREAAHADRWYSHGGLHAQSQVGLSCNYCGSLHPDTLMNRVREGWHLAGTDKGYKWYLNRPWTEAERAHILAQPWAHTWVDTGKQLAKFYTVHLSRAQAEEIIAMAAMGILNHSWYVRPHLPVLDAAAPAWLVGS